MKCVGGKGRHQLVNNNPGTKDWQDTVAAAARRWGLTTALVGPVDVTVTFTVARPASVKPAARRWPWKKPARVLDGGGDLDKLARTVLDGLEQAHVLADDAQVCVLSVVKAYPDCGWPDVLERPGAVVRVRLMGEDE